MRHVRNGKIARLPASARTKVNLMLRDNVLAPLIAARINQEHAHDLKQLGIDPVTRHNVGEWRGGGYGDWERQQERLEVMRFQQEFALELAQRNGSSVEQANLALAASQICEILQDFDLRDLKTKLQEKPELYSMLIDAVSKISRAGLGERKWQLELTKYKDKVAEQKRIIEQELGSTKAASGLTPETIERIREALSLL